MVKRVLLSIPVFFVLLLLLLFSDHASWPRRSMIGITQEP
jgi:hypothetical protein